MGEKSERLLARREAVVARGVPRVTPATVDTARGALLRDLDGRELIDFAGGIGVVNAGHCEPDVVDAICAQAKKLLHTCIHVATYEPYVELCEKLVALLPHGGPTKAMLVNSGAEAVENAVKIARQASGRPALLCYGEGFHGRTLLGMTLTSKTAYKRGCGPFAPEVYRLPFPNHYRHGDGLGLDAFVERELERLRHALAGVVGGEEIAAVVIEPVQGEGGFVPAPEKYLRGLRRVCDEHGILLIFDEVQTGFGRTGNWGAFQGYGVVPDLSTWAKSLGSGLPIAAVLGRAEVMDAAAPGTIGGTYGGNPVACAAALATLERMGRLDLNRRAREVGERVRARFRALQSRCEHVGDVRGLGAMIGMELVEPGSRRPAGALASAVVARCVERGLLLISAGTYSNVIRVLAPLVIEFEQLERGLDILEQELLGAAAAPAAVA